MFWKPLFFHYSFLLSVWNRARKKNHFFLSPAEQIIYYLYEVLYSIRFVHFHSKMKNKTNRLTLVVGNFFAESCRTMLISFIQNSYRLLLEFKKIIIQRKTFLIWKIIKLGEKIKYFRNNFKIHKQSLELPS